ncbi:type IV secretion system protein (plasmid) [Ureibacillus chungkukjangi]|uniref:hypothetical protein n=1 Tax=Ureibacillus chungkukjangi TaxID=1202712 RepID=UPI000D35DBDD|nr:hypothetical protein [Ureibacillus chungkukjangi]
MFEGISDKISSIFEKLIEFLFESFLGPFLGLDSLEGLIFGRPESMKDETVVWGTFADSDLVNAFNPLYNSMTMIAGFFFIAAIALGGIRITSSAYNPIRRNEFMEFCKELILVGIGLFFLPTFYGILFELNMGIVQFFDSMTDFQTLNAESDFSEFEDGSDETGILGKIIIQLILLGLSLWASFYYMMRRITLLILLSMGPLMLVFWMVPQLKSMTSAWLKELSGSIFVQSIHSFVFFTVGVISMSSSGLLSTIIVYVVFIPISESIRGLLGMGGNMQGGLSKAGAMFGMSAISGMVGAAKGAMQDKSVMGALKGIKDGAKGGSEGGDISEGLTGENFADTKAAKMLKAGDIVSKMGKASMGMAGAIAGSGLGPVGSIVGAEMGSQIGGLAGGITGRVGAAGVLGVGDKLKDAKESVKDLKALQGNEDNVMANAIANEQATNWANNNREAVMNKLREDFPNATPQDIQKKFNDIKEQKTANFIEDASKEWATAKEVAGDLGNATKLVKASANSMANKWASNNREQFMNDYDANNPKAAGESDSVYSARKEQAFSNRVAEMKDKFMQDGNQFAQANMGSNGLISRKSLAESMGQSASLYANDGDSSNLTEAATSGMEHVQGAALFSKKGRPNMGVLANSLAVAKTQQQGEKFIVAQMGSGLSQEQAQQQWSAKQEDVLKNNVASYNSGSFTASIGKVQPLPNNAVHGFVQSSGAFLAGATGYNKVAKGLETVNAGLAVGSQAYQVKLQESGLKALPSAVVGGVGAGINGMLNQRILQQGDTVQAHHNLSNNAGYTAGVVFGRTGMQKAHKAVNTIANSRFSPLSTGIQTQISSPSEVLQMAQKVVDDNGVEQIASGAIRQVITRDSSYVQVRTNSGEIRTVSRIGAGNESLKKGETIYQDLSSNDGMTLNSSTPVGNSKATMYRMDSGGARIPVNNLRNQQDPISLLGNSSHAVHSEVPRKETPVLNQKVDMGNFYVEDLKKANMNNIQMVMDKGRSFVTAEQEGVTYRVSPIMQGDARFASNQTVSVPLRVNKGSLQPAEAISKVAVNAQSMYAEQSTAKTNTVVQTINLSRADSGTRQVIQKNVQVLGENSEPLDYKHYDNLDISSMMKSKYVDRAERGVNRRRRSDIVRRKQGILG